MLFNRSNLKSAAILAPALLLCAHASASPVSILSATHDIDSTARTITFTATFDRALDLVTTDAHGRRADLFQYFFDSDFNWATGEVKFLPPNQEGTFGGAGGADVVFRPVSPTTIRYFTDAPWGAPRGDTAFALAANTVTITASWELLRYNGGHFAYAIDTYRYGELGSTTLGTNLAIIPLPGASGLASAGLLGLALRRPRRA